MRVLNPLARWRERREAKEEELERELGADLELEAEERCEQGESAEEANYAAMRSLGNSALVKEDVRQAWGWMWVEILRQDVRYGLRGLRKNPGFTAVAVLSLAIGIGGNTAVFTLINAVLLRTLPYPEPHRLLSVGGFYPKGAVAAMQERSRTMDIAGYMPDAEMNLTGRGEAMRVVGSMVSSNFFSVAGMEAQLGRTLRAEEDRPGRDNVVVLSDALWRKKFAADPMIVGRPIVIDGVAREVVGVMPAAFGFPSSSVQVWTPLRMDSSNRFDYWNTNFMPLLARLRPDASLTQAQRELHPLILEAITAFPYPMPTSWNADATVIPLQQFLVNDVRRKLLVLQYAVALVLLIACANVASLLLARTVVRQKEMALRSALGAARGRIVRQLLTESVVLGMVGGAAGLALAYGALSVFKHVLPVEGPGWETVRISPQVLLFVSLLAMASGLLFGSIPAFSGFGSNLSTTLRADGRRTTTSVRAGLRSVLIAGEITLAVVLAVSAGLLVKSLWKLAQVNPGFAPAHILTMRVAPDKPMCEERERCVALYAQLLERTREISGVSDVAITNLVPLTGEMPSIPVELEGHSDAPGEMAPSLLANATMPEYFRMMNIPLLAGRSFTDGDNDKAELVVMVSAETAKRFWPGQDPIGKHVRPVWGNEPWRRVIGVVGDVREYRLSVNLPDGIFGVVYMPYAQAVGNDRQVPASMALMARTDRDPEHVAGEIRRLVAQVNPNVPVGEVQTMEAVVSLSKSSQRSMMWLFVCFAGAAILLAAIGTYGVIAFSTAQRMYEMGVRIALGATRRNLFGMVLGLSLRLVLIGVACGIVLAFAVTRLLSSFLYGVSAWDPLTFLAVVALMVGIAMVAGFAPARRASRVDPMTALRAE